MPAKSEAQQRLMGMALAAKRGKGHFSEKIQEVAKSMSEKQLRDFAKTKHKGLPEKKAYMTTQEQAYINGFVKRAAEHGVGEDEASELLKSAGIRLNGAILGSLLGGVASAPVGGIEGFLNPRRTINPTTGEEVGHGRLISALKGALSSGVIGAGMGAVGGAGAGHIAGSLIDKTRSIFGAVKGGRRK